jgi:HTH-type transcriptional regulator / antitoxin HigA
MTSSPTPGEWQQVEAAWATLAPWLMVPQNAAEYRRLVTLLYALIDSVGEDEAHPLASLMELVGELVARYDETHAPELA